MKTPDNQKFGFVAVIGEPNAGKSTLINQIIGEKISIVSPKAQTTRTRVLGIAIEGDAQIVFVDTPGIFEADKKNNLERAIVSSAWEGVADSEIILLLVDASKKIGASTQIILDRLLADSSKKAVLILNKIDKIKRELLLDKASKLNEAYNFEATFMLSALKGNGVSDLLSYLVKEMPQEKWHFPVDQMTDMPMRLAAAEVTREKLFKMLHQELPYHLTVETEKWESLEDDSIKIDQVIFIDREAHKKIILGKGGSMIKKIGSQSRAELEKIMDCRVHLKLFVKVQSDWMSDEERYTLWGLDPNA